MPNVPLQAAVPSILNVVCGYVRPSAGRSEGSDSSRGEVEVTGVSTRVGGKQPTQDGQPRGGTVPSPAVEKATAKATSSSRQAQPSEQVPREGAFSSPQVPLYGAGEGAARWTGPHGEICFTPFSVVSQMDGLMKSLLGLRVERDVHARTRAESCCIHFGSENWMSWSSFTGIYCPGCRDTDIRRTITKATAEHAVGVFVVPQAPFKIWYQDLTAKAMLTFHIPVYEVSAGIAGLACVQKSTNDFVAVVANFEWFGRLKTKRRKERVFRLEAIRELDALGAKKVPAIPYLISRTSPLATDTITAANDTLKCGGKFIMAEGVQPPKLAPLFWVPGALQNAAKGFPFPEVLDLAVQGTSGGINPFRGVLQKSIKQAPFRFESADTGMAARAQYMADVEATYTAGPFKSVPFEWARVCKWFTVPKDKYNSLDKRVRLVSHYSHGGTGSINELCYTPKMIGVHHSAASIKTRIAMCGKDAKVRAWDIPKCFKRQRLPLEILHLFCYMVVTEDFGEEYFVDRSTPFGWTPAEWQWQCILAVVMWIMLIRRILELITFVDNFFDIQPSSVDITRNERVIESTFAELGLEGHEKQGVTPEGVGVPRFKGLGWEFDTHKMVMVLPEAKWKRFCTMLTEWRAKDTMSVEAIRKAVGYMLCFSCGFLVGKPLVAYMVHAKTEGEQKVKASGLAPDAVHVKLNPNAAMAMNFWERVFSTWDRTCPIVAEFTPQSGCQVLLRSDASTDWGWGGLVWCSPYEPSTAEARIVHGIKGQWTDADRAKAKALLPTVEDRMTPEKLAMPPATAAAEITAALKRESTAVFEAMALLATLRVFVHECEGKRVLIEIDNSTVVRALEGMYSPTPSVMAVILEIGVFCCEHNITIRTRWVLGRVFNVITDRLSHDLVSQAEAACRAELGRELVLRQ